MPQTPLPDCIVLAASAVAVPLTGTTTETALATITIPAGALGANGWVEIEHAWSYTNSANNKTERVRLGGLAGTAFHSTVATTSASLRAHTRIANRGVANSQFGFVAAASFGGSSAASVTGAIDTSAAQDIVISGQLANTGETITLESYTVKLYPRP